MPIGNPCILNQVTNKEFEKSITPEERQMFWRYAKAIGADKGVDHPTVISQMAQKFNMPARLVAQALEGPKTLRKVSDEVRARQRASAQFIAANKRHLESLDRTGAQKFVNFMNDGVRRVLLLYHGPVPPVTHAIDVAATNPVKFTKMYIRGFQALSKNAHERILGTMEADPLFQTFKDAGAPIGREDAEGFHKTGWAGRAMDTALKPLRFEMMKATWEKTPEAERTPEFAKLLAQQYAHATGALVKGEKVDVVTRGIRKAFLAPQLTPSKWAKSVFDPIETVKTFERLTESKLPGSTIRPPSPAERRIAYNRLGRAAKYMGVTLGALALNKAILQAVGSKQKVNDNNPLQGDYLALKFGGRSFRMRGTSEIAALLSKLLVLGTQSTGKKHAETDLHKFLREKVPGFGGIPEKGKFGASSPEEAFAKYSEYKLTPGIGLGKELLTGKDVFGRPVPWSNDPGTDRFPRKNMIEFVGEHTPIFMGHAVSAFHEKLREEGVDTRTSMNVLRSLAKNPVAAGHALEEAAMEGGAEFFGWNIQPDRYMDGAKPEAEPKPKSKRKPLPGFENATSL